MNWMRTHAIALFFLALLAGGVATGQLAASAQELTGAGSTFINPVMQNWIAAYKKATGVAINYQPIGSGGGISGLINHTVDFAGSDAPMNPQELADAKAPVLHLPVVIGTVCIAYNIPGIGPGIHLSGPVLADIYLGTIRYWDDRRIASLSPGTKFPHQPIFVAHRSDGSGTTYIFTDYLSKISPEWNRSVGTGKSVRWPVGLGAKGTEGVAGLIRTHAYSIGYIELAYAIQNDIPYAFIQNARGKFIYPSMQSGSVAASGVSLPPDMRVTITNTAAPNGYPITGFSWLIVYRDSPKAAALKQFLSWVLTTGQEYNAKLQYGAIPAPVRKREMQMVASIK
ncbi:MAG TPA: phosphate ABC transporter substrate-binding protein PstS [Chthonomonadaceae bacterium]|nr:phosphate ABC transporter substrate-binding protein PstS [Chthonomonadaceae bacterium]